VNDGLGAAILLLLFLGVIGTAETLIRRKRLAPEPARKLIHLAGGLGCLLFPFLISSWITVLILAALFGAVFYLGENRGLLRSLASVDRRSCGSMIFPLAIFLLFIISEGRIWLYVSALLVLVLADTAAALAGVRFGRTFYETAPGERKSLEGTLAFCAAGFLAVFLPLVSTAGFPPVTCALTALLMTLLLAALEAVSISGTDNLYVPLGTVYLLLKIPEKPQPEILFQCISLLGISAAIVILNRKHTTLRVRPLVLFLLTAYAAWTLGSAEWIIPVVTGFILYNRLCAGCRPLSGLSARGLLRPLYPTLGILFLANSVREFDFWFLPFSAATATAASLCIVHRLRKEPVSARLSGLRLPAAVLLPIGAALLLLLPFRMDGIGRAALVALPLCGGTAAAYNRFAPLELPPFAWNFAIPILAAAVAGTIALLQTAGIAPVLEPTTWAEVFR
jgi:dolichol kinase